jgi:SPP1 family predicted phage head-tail adaptor
MRAGNLDRLVSIERCTVAVDAYGTAIDTWALFATMRAQVLQYSTDDRETAHGNSTDRSITFRMRWLDGLTLEHRVSYEGQPFKIKQIKEIGRRVGLDLICERVGP